MTMITRAFSTVLLLLWGLNVALADTNDEIEFNRVQFSQALQGRDTSLKLSAMAWLAQHQPERAAKSILTAWLNGNLYVDKTKPDALYILDGATTAQQAMLAWSGESASLPSQDTITKLRVNNKLRGAIRSELATLRLNSPLAEVRTSAVTELLGTSESQVLTQLEARQSKERDAQVQSLLTLALTIPQALDVQGTQRIEAIQRLSEYKHAVVLKTLNQIIASDADADVLTAAERGLADYKQSQRFYSGVETVFFGLSLGSVLVLAGIGLAITFGVMGVINMAHGELIMIGAYTTYVMQELLPSHIGLAVVLSVPVAFVVSGAVGIVIERSVIRHLYGRPLETLLATFGISLILQQAVRSIFSPLNRSVSTPDWMTGALEINPMLSLTYNRLYIVLFCALVFAGLVMVLKKTPLGLQVRAVSQNRSMARAMGIRSQRVDALTFGLGSGVAGVAGVALSQLTNVGPNMGQAYIIDSFMVVVFGGVGNLWGTLVAGLSLGMFNKVLEPWAGAVLAKIMVLVFIILFIQKRPRGLFPQRGRAAES